MQKLAMRTRSRGAETTEENQAATFSRILQRKYGISATYSSDRQTTEKQPTRSRFEEYHLALLDHFLFVERESMSQNYLAGVPFDERQRTLHGFWQFPDLLRAYAGESWEESERRYFAAKRRLSKFFTEIDAAEKAKQTRRRQDEKIQRQSRLDAVYRCIAARPSGATAREVANDTGIGLELVRYSIQTLRRDNRLRTSSFHAGRGFAEHIYVAAVF